MAAARIAARGADLVLGCDLVTAASERGHGNVQTPARTHAVVNSHEVMSAQFTRDADFQLPGRGDAAAHPGPRTRLDGAHFVDATDIATALLGDAMASNMFTLGYAYQQGLIPVGAAAIERAIELNGVSVG